MGFVGEKKSNEPSYISVYVFAYRWHNGGLRQNQCSKQEQYMLLIIKIMPEIFSYALKNGKNMIKYPFKNSVQ